LKDEVREADKVDAGKSRLISASCLEYVILWRKYFGAFTSAVQQTRISNGMALGFKPILETEEMLRYFDTIEDGGFLAGDYSKFDSSQQPQVIERLVNYMRGWLDPDGTDVRADAIRGALAKDLYSSVHLNGFDGEYFTAMKDTLYTWPVSMPSGHPATTVINCLYNLFAFAYCFIKLCPDDVSQYHNLTKPVVYGDDNIVRTKRTISHVFNQATIAEVMASDLGLCYTNETKDGVSGESRGIDDVSFLKRRFSRLVDGGMGMIIALESIDKAICWTSKGVEFGQTLRNVLLELSTHPHSVWQEYVSQLKACGARLDDGRVYTQDVDCQRQFLLEARQINPYMD
jgi:hypothetical protein